METIPFGRVIKLGNVGRDCQAVRRALARAGFGKLGNLGPVFGVSAVRNLKVFQKDHFMDGDGIYGPRTHQQLVPHFDDYSFLLYTGKPPRPPQKYLLLPTSFTPTHQTSGLEGYPAIDCFAAPGTVILSPAGGTVRRLSGKNPSQGGIPGGAYGLSMYLAEPHQDRYMTHFQERFVNLGQTVKKGEALGVVCDAKVASMPSSLTHIHMGLSKL